MSELQIITATHFFKCINIAPRARPVIDSFARTLVLHGWVRERNTYVKAPLKVFAMATHDRSEYRFHINLLDAFKRHLIEFRLVDDMVQYSSIPIPIPVDVDIKIKDHWVLRDYQIPIVDYLLSNDAPVSKFVNLQTGMGKSFIAMKAISTLRYRTLIVVKPMYLEKWVEDIERTYDIDPDDVVVIRGSSQLLTLLTSAENNELDFKIILISSKTIANWLKLYEKYMSETIEMGYPCLPEDLCKLLGIGVLVLDEVHQEFHANFKFLLTTNVFRSISLSATLISEDPFISKMYGVAYPVTSQYGGNTYSKYVIATAVFYTFKNPFKIQSTDRVSKNYNHHLLEQSVLKQHNVKVNYLNLINDSLKGSYLLDYKPGQRCLIFCMSVDMCTVVTAYLRKQHPHLNINRYVADDEFESLMTSDISVSTLGSAGTAVDIDMLHTVILTIAVSSIQANIQSIGRLRPLKDGRNPRFLYFVCTDIPKHIVYHESKRELLETRAHSYNNVYYNNQI